MDSIEKTIEILNFDCRVLNFSSRKYLPSKSNICFLCYMTQYHIYTLGKLA